MFFAVGPLLWLLEKFNCEYSRDALCLAKVSIQGILVTLVLGELMAAVAVAVDRMGLLILLRTVAILCVQGAGGPFMVATIIRVASTR